MTNKISVILDVATDKAVTGLKGFKQSINDADGAFGKMKAGSASVFDSIKANAGLAGLAVAAAIGAAAGKSIEAASKLGESINAVNVTFGQSAAGIKALGEEAAESVGLSNSAFNSLAVQFSSFAETIAGKGGDVVGTIDEMTTRAADFASVMNIDVAEAARLFQSGLAGETEPLKKFGIDLSAAAVEAHALEKGLVASKSEMTEAVKVQARYSLLMEETAKTAGDFAETSDGLANSQRILSAKMEDTAAKAGKKLAPALAQVTTMLSDIIPVAGNVAVGVGEAFEKMVDAAYDFGQGIADVVDALPFVDLKGPIAETLYEQEKLARGTEELVDAYSKGAPTFKEFVAALQDQGLSQHAVNLAMIEYRDRLDEALVAQQEHIPTIEDYIRLQEESGGALDDTAASTDDLSRANENLANKIEQTTNRFRDLKGELDAEEVFHNAQGMWDELGVSAVAAMDAAAAGTDDASAKMFDHKGKVIDAKQQVVELGEQYADLPEEEITKIVALIDEGSLEEAERRFNILARNREMNISIIAKGGAGYSNLPNFDGGGTVPGPVGKPQLAVVHGGEEVLTPAQQNAAGGLGNSTINFYSNGPPTLADLSHAFAMLRLSR